MGGHDASENKYPYFATFGHFGGGVLIAPDIILSAGHVHPPVEQHVKVRLNHSHFSSTNYSAALPDNETYAITAIVQHPAFYTISGHEKVHDYSLFVLDRPSTIPPVKLNRRSRIPEPGQIVKVVGMGSMSPNPATFVQTSATNLQVVELEVLSHNQCLETSGDPLHRPHVSYHGRVFSECMFCTSGGPNNEKDSCAFDSGSPLLMKNRHGETIVVGLVSWGEPCADPYFPAVNARVSYAIDWIEATVCALSKADPSQLTDFRCDERDDDDDYYFQAAEFVRPIYDDSYHSFGTRGPMEMNDTTAANNSGLNAMMALAAAASVGLALVILRLQVPRRPIRRLSSMNSSRRGSTVIYEGSLLSTQSAKATIDIRPEGEHSPDEPMKTYDTFSGQSI